MSLTAIFNISEMDVQRPLRVGLFFYEIVRLLLLIACLFIPSLEGGFNGGGMGSRTFSPQMVYLSANALFPLMALFLWLKPEEYRSYLNLYIAGKIIGLISFYAWEVFSFREFFRTVNFFKNMILLGSSVLISLADILSVWGAWRLKNKIKQVLDPDHSDEACGSGRQSVPGPVSESLIEKSGGK